MESGPAFSQLVQLLQIGHRGGVYYPRLFNYTQQHTKFYREHYCSPHLLRPALDGIL